MTTFKGFTLSAFQIQSVEAIRRGENLLVSAPTGAGKTLVAEYAIYDAIQRGKRVIYTAPIKALSNQKYRDFRDDPDVDVGLMTGDVTIHPEAQVLIMTTEILRNQIFENPGMLKDVDYVIFDEVHFMDDRERGTVWEETFIFAPKGIRFVSLSATIQNLDQLGSWIREIRDEDLTVVRSDKRPVPLKHGRVFRQAPKLDRLLDEVQENNAMPVLVFSFSRKDVERLAYANQHRELLNDEELERMKALQLELVKSYDLDESELIGDVYRLARHGIGYHHAGMLPIHKEVVERMFCTGLLKMIFTTETFAIGINMPARTVVFASLKKYDGISMDYLRTRDYLQMAGRAGRQGIDKEGLVISMLGMKDLEEAPLKRILSGNPEPVQSRFKLSYSTLLHLISHMGRSHIHEAWDKSFNRYQHREGSKKAREHNRRKQHELLDNHLDFLEELGYFEPEGPEVGRGALTGRGKLSSHIYGYEVQVTELLYQGILEDLPAKPLAMVFTALVYEERRREGVPRLPARLYGDLRKKIDRTIADMQRVEARFGIDSPMRTCDWGLTRPLFDWIRGGTLEEIEERMDTGGGDFVRCLRMTVQLLRNARRAVPKDWAMYDSLGDAIELLNRDEVDATRQLELG